MWKGYPVNRRGGSPLFTEIPRRLLLGSSVNRGNPLLTSLSLPYSLNPFHTTTLPQPCVSPCPFLSLPLHLIPDRSAVLSLAVLRCPPVSLSGTDYESEGRRFESCRARYTNTCKSETFSLSQLRNCLNLRRWTDEQRLSNSRFAEKRTLTV
jgi:hypothetical protein